MAYSDLERSCRYKYDDTRAHHLAAAAISPHALLHTTGQYTYVLTA